ncbi:dehydrogenase [Mycolicibacterium confluentis]|uniref:Dehydrogenase n=1 Tax=Mycolicibacterium confluentis TaxID=28047 RepID=A0A7I7Y0L8_9MYCO|nr:dehydrogenase [Mycolicibacterium confluentis]
MKAIASAHSDVLIVGAGSAGSVLAERLSSDPQCSVTVVETGPGPAEPGVQALTDSGTLLPIGSDSELVTRYASVLTQDPPRTAHLVRGRTVGGSGAVNGGYFCRAVPADIAAWDLPGWDWPTVLAHYRAVETDLDFDGPLHGDSGPIHVQRTSEYVGATALFLEACERAGVAWLPDLNGVESGALPSGVGRVPLNIVEGRRMGPGAAFLVPAMRRPNLSVLTRARVLRIRFHRGRAVGVDVTRPHGPEGPDGVTTLTADRIVLSSGAIGTAHLLMLSGIGPEPALRRAGVPVVQPLPVGMHCVDHPEWVLPTNWSVEPGRPVLEVVLSIADDLEIRPYTGGFVAMVGGVGADHPDWPHLGVALMKPQSYASVALVSADPTTPPEIEHRYDRVADDIKRLEYGTEVVREIIGTAAEVGEHSWSTSQHLGGSAPMGRADDPRAVLDEQCRVRGVEGLWVIDGSVLPSALSRGPHATTVMLAHRAAGFVSPGA